MSVRKRKWTTSRGEAKEAWIVDYVDHGKRCQKTFAKKKVADAWYTTTKVEIRNGVHTPDSASITVKEAGELWIKAAEKDLERATVACYRQYLDLHIAPYLGSVKLSQLSAPMVRDFEDKLRHGVPAPGADNAKPRSKALVRKVRVSLGTLLADAHRRKPWASSRLQATCSLSRRVTGDRHNVVGRRRDAATSTCARSGRSP
jgi:integrase